MNPPILDPSRPDVVVAANRLYALLNAGDALPLDPGGTSLQPGQIYALVNDGRFIESYFDEPLTTYVRGWRDPNDIEAMLEFFAPVTVTNRRFTYKSAVNIEEFYSDSDDIRAIGGAFKRVEYTGTEVQAKTVNRGLMLVVDLDEAAPGWEQRSTAKLLRRLYRNSLRRAKALLSAAATNTAKTWDTTALKDPDQDVMSELILAAVAAGVRPNRIGYGDTAWSKRFLAHRAQATAGGFASSGLTEQQVASLLGIDQVKVSHELYQSSISAKLQILGNLVLMFNAISGSDEEDPSNIKRFVSPSAQGGNVGVYMWDIGPKLRAIAVEHYELIAITSTLGIRQFTIS